MIKSFTPKTICDSPKGFSVKENRNSSILEATHELDLQSGNNYNKISFLLIGNMKGKTWVLELFTLSKHMTFLQP